MIITDSMREAYSEMSTGMCVSVIEQLMRDVYYSHDDKELLDIRLEVLIILIDKIIYAAPTGSPAYNAYLKLKQKIRDRLLPKTFIVNTSTKAFDNVFNQKFPYGFKHHLSFTVSDLDLVNKMRYCATATEFEFCQFLVSPEVISRLKVFK